MSKAKIYCLGHKIVDYGMPNDELYTSIQCNACQGHINEQFQLFDDDGEDNISAWNPVYAEWTSHYWIWKHHEPLDYIGICQYRKRFVFDPKTDFDEIFKDYDVIVPYPAPITGTVREQFRDCHCERDLDMAEIIVKRMYPEYAKDWDDVINNGHTLYYSAGLVVRAEDFDKFCAWMFPIFMEYRRFAKFKTIEDVSRHVDYNMRMGLNDTRQGLVYQTRMFGALSERLLTLFVLHNFKKDRIKHMEYMLMEPM